MDMPVLNTCTNGCYFKTVVSRPSVIQIPNIPVAAYSPLATDTETPPGYYPAPPGYPATQGYPQLQFPPAQYIPPAPVQQVIILFFGD